MTDDSRGEQGEASALERSAGDGITRRQVLRGAAAASAVLAGGGLLAACGSSGGSSSAATGSAAPTGAIKPGGNLRVGTTGGGAQDSIDAHFATSDPDISRLHQLYEPLAVRDPDFTLQMLLAESMTPGAKPDVWTVRLRPGVTFHNGKPVTADDVIFSLQRIINPKKPGTGAASIGYVDLARTKKIDNQTVSVALQFPNVGFPDDVGQYFNGIVPVGYDPKNPIGTGPFKYQRFTPGQQSVFVKYPELLERSCARRPGDDHRLRRRHRESQRPARQSGRCRHEPPSSAALPGAGDLGAEGADLAVRGVAAVHDAGRPAAV